jgi:hypothetical protein
MTYNANDVSEEHIASIFRVEAEKETSLRAGSKQSSADGGDTIFRNVG